MEALIQLLKKVPALCWAMVCLCMMIYTATLCTVMLRSSEINLTINGMAMNMSKAATDQKAAALELESAAQIITELRGFIAEMKEAHKNGDSHEVSTIPPLLQPPPVHNHEHIITPDPVEVTKKVDTPKLPEILKEKHAEEALLKKASQMRNNADQIQQQVQNIAPFK